MSVQQNLFQVKVYDYLMTADNKPIVGKQVSLQASVDAIAISQSGTSVMIPMTNVFSTKTDQFGYWSILINPTDKFSVNGVLYTVMDGIHEEYQIDAPFAGVPGAGWQSSARIQNAPAVLTPTGQTLTGPLIAPSITDSGLTVGQVVFAGAAGLLSSDAALAWNNVTKVLSLGGSPSQLAMQGVGSAAIYGGTVGFQINNNAGTQANLTIGDAGFSTFRGALAVNGAFLSLGAAPAELLMSGAGQAIIGGGTTGLAIWNNALGFKNLDITDVGTTTIRGAVFIGGTTAIQGGALSVVTGGIFLQAAGSTANDINMAIGTAQFRVTDSVGSAILTVAQGTTSAAFRNSLQIGGDAGSGVAATLTLTNVVGIGNGANTNMQAPLKATGGGPTSAILVTDWIKIYDGTVTRWIPAFT